MTEEKRPSAPALEALRQVHPPHLLHSTVTLLGMILLTTGLALIFAPWQQTAVATGKVLAYAPGDREQTIEAPIEGVIVDWRVQEGQTVSAGEVLGEISDNDPLIMTRLGDQRTAALRSLEAATATVMAYERKITSLADAQSQAVAVARARLGMGRDRAEAAMRAVEAARAAEATAKLNRDRQQTLADKGLTSTKDREAAELRWNKAKADLAEARMGFSAAQGEILALQAEVEKASATAQVELEKARASLEEARGKEAKAASELASVDTRLSRQASMTLTAPRDGTIVRVNVRPGGEVVKAGDALARFVSDTTQRAVELWVDGNDAPLITPGTPARLQFEGWPAIQFSGWPSVAVGTFGGEVALVDATIDADGLCRVIVIPDEDEPAWPEASHLRQGVRAGGWLLLGEVSLGYEIWRRANGFPPSKRAEEQAKGEKE